MKQLIVNADDFGLTSGVNRAVIEGHRHGIITSATLMANMPGFDEAVHLARDHPSLGVGLHFNLTQGAPVAAPAQVRSLTNARGEFWGTATTLARRSLTGRLRTEEIIIELRTQIEKALAAGLRLTHLDSHQHSHAIPQVFAAIARTIPDYGIAAVRLIGERPHLIPLSFRVVIQSAVALGLKQLCHANRMLGPDPQPHTVRAFFGIAQTGCWTKRWLMEVIERLPAGVSELMCHPGYEDDELGQVTTRLRTSRAVELKLLTDPQVAAWLRECAVILVNYSQLGVGPPII